jgi:putative Mn2+ efflux pump MntP
MTFLEVFLLAVSLCFDTLAVSIVGGACLGRLTFGKVAKILLFMALFQGGFTFAGWALGASVEQYIARYDHWVAFLLLAFIGGRMIVESFSKKEETKQVDLLGTGHLILASAATSIDALAVGISLAIVGTAVGRMAYYCTVIALVTAAAAAIGIFGGDRLGRRLGSRINLLGGLILIGIGVKILLEHLFF